MPISKPSSLPRWASDVGAVITEPSPSEKDSGFVPNTPALAATTNWLLNKLYQWMLYLNDPQAMSVVDLAVQGGLTVGGVPVATTATFTYSANGLVPAPGGSGSSRFLRENGAWEAPPSGGVSDGDKGDIVVLNSGAVWTIEDNAVTYAKMQDVAADSMIGRVGSTGTPHAVSFSDLAVYMPVFAEDVNGTVPAPGLANGTKLLRDDATWVPIASFGDGWTYVKLTSTVTATDTTPVNTGLAFTPAADKTYVVEGFLMLRTDNYLHAARPALSWPTGLTDGTAVLHGMNGAGETSAQTYRIPAGQTAAQPTTSMPGGTGSWGAQLQATLVTGSLPSGDFVVTLQSESTVDVHVRAGSWIRYREI